jgi:hypothetical protein
VFVGVFFYFSRNILSFGDSSHERDAMIQVCSARADTRWKSVKLIERPEPEHILEVQRLIRTFALAIAKHQGNLDWLSRVAPARAADQSSNQPVIPTVMFAPVANTVSNANLAFTNSRATEEKTAVENDTREGSNRKEAMASKNASKSENDPAGTESRSTLSLDGVPTKDSEPPCITVSGVLTIESDLPQIMPPTAATTTHAAERDGDGISSSLKLARKKSSSSVKKVECRPILPALPLQVCVASQICL